MLMHANITLGYIYGSSSHSRRIQGTDWDIGDIIEIIIIKSYDQSSFEERESVRNQNLQELWRHGVRGCG